MVLFCITEAPCNIFCEAFIGNIDGHGNFYDLVSNLFHKFSGRVQTTKNRIDTLVIYIKILTATRAGPLQFIHF